MGRSTIEVFATHLPTAAGRSWNQCLLSAREYITGEFQGDQVNTQRFGRATQEIAQTHAAVGVDETFRCVPVQVPGVDVLDLVRIGVAGPDLPARAGKDDLAVLDGVLEVDGWDLDGGLGLRLGQELPARRGGKVHVIPVSLACRHQVHVAHLALDTNPAEPPKVCSLALAAPAGEQFPAPPGVLSKPFLGRIGAFVAVGDGEKLNSIKNGMSTYLNQRVKLLGKQQNVESIINIFTIGVLTTNAKVIGEGISNSIMEYMALGKPVIATDFGGNGELVVDGETGFLVKPGDVEELTFRIMQLLDNPMGALQFGHRGLKRIQTDFSLEKMSRAYTTLYNNVMNAK